MIYRYIDYTPEMEAVIDSWLDDDGAYFTGFEDGFAAYYGYWINVPDHVLGENYWAKIICDKDTAVGCALPRGIYGGNQ